MAISVAITSPTDGDVINGPVPVFVPSASATSTHPIDNVEFFLGGKSIGQVPPTIDAYSPLISGDIFPTNGLAVVEGVGTLFLTDFAVNDFVIFTSQPTEIYRVLSIASNISLTLTTPYTGATPTPTIIGTVSLTNGLPAVLGAGTAITGTVSVTNGLAAVTGVGTSFLADLVVGSRVIITSQPTVVYRVLSIADNLNLILTDPFTGATIAGTTLQKDITSFLTDLLIGSFIIITSQPTIRYRVLSIADEINLTLTTPFTGATVAGTTIQKAFLTTMRPVTLSSNYNIATTNVQPGAYILSATATDILGATATSALITITIVGFLSTLPTSSSLGSSIGFGHNPFGEHQFGFGDWAEEMLWKTLPEFYREIDELGPSGSIVQQPLRKFQNALKPSYQDLRVKWHQFPFLWDALVVPIAQLPQLGYNVGITVDSTKDENLQRSSVFNASQLWVNKGADKGYEITGAFEGLLVTITPLWAETSAPASQVLGSNSSPCECFELDTTLLHLRPVSPETVHLQLTTSYGIVEDIRDNGIGGLVGSGNEANGPLTRLAITSSVALSVTSVSGVFVIGNTLTQGATSGVILAFSGTVLTVRPTAGLFALGTVTDAGTGATANAIATAVLTIAAGETFTGLTSGTTAVMRDFQGTYAIIDKITSGNGFTVGETLFSSTSGGYATAGASTALVEGPLRIKLTLGSVVNTFAVEDEITGAISGSTGVVRQVVGTTTLWVDTITTPGFSVTETITTTTPASAAITAIGTATVDYISGKMEGQTVFLQANSTVNSIVDLATTGPTQFLPHFDTVPTGAIPMDDVQSDRYTEWPVAYDPVRIKNGILTRGESRSHSLQLFFSTPNNTEIDEFIGVMDRINLSLERFRPIHVNFDKISFDGARAASQLWRTGAIISSSAATSVWVAPVLGVQLASSQVWTSGPLTANTST